LIEESNCKGKIILCHKKVAIAPAGRGYLEDVNSHHFPRPAFDCLLQGADGVAGTFTI